jgi:hypothetical protein
MDPNTLHLVRKLGLGGWFYIRPIFCKNPSKVRSGTPHGKTLTYDCAEVSPAPTISSAAIEKCIVNIRSAEIV